MDRLKVIFDTDPGIDDAMALLFLHRAQEVDLLGITTGFGNASIENTTYNALYLCERFGIDVPVARGAGAPLVVAAGSPPDFVHGQNGLGNVALPAQLAKGTDPRPAYQFIIDTVRANPGDVSIVAVGRLTNLALALRAAPDIAPLIGNVIVMGGAFGHNGHGGNVTPCSEANIIGDPHAADEVLGAALPLTMVGLDVTQEVRMSQAFLKALGEDGDEIGRFIWDISRFYEDFHRANGLNDIYVHDSSAVAYLLRPDLFQTKTGCIRVLTNGIGIGQTILKPDGAAFPPGPWDRRTSMKVCVDVDSEGLLDLYGRTIMRRA